MKKEMLLAIVFMIGTLSIGFAAAVGEDEVMAGDSRYMDATTEESSLVRVEGQPEWSERSLYASFHDTPFMSTDMTDNHQNAYAYAIGYLYTLHPVEMKNANDTYFTKTQGRMWWYYDNGVYDAAGEAKVPLPPREKAIPMRYGYVRQ